MQQAVWAALAALVATSTWGQGTTMSPNASRVDFSYAFGLPHRMTVALPDSGNKTLVDTHADHLSLRWTYGSLRNITIGAYMPLGSSWSGDLWLEADGHRLPLTGHRRAEGILPVLAATAGNGDGQAKLSMVGGQTAGLVRVELTNPSDKPHRYQVVFNLDGGFGEVPGYLNADDPLDYMLAGWNDRADRVMLMTAGGTPVARRDTPARTLAMAWDLAPGQTASGWLLRPYNAFTADVAKLRSHDWAAEFAAGQEAWRRLLGSTVRITIPDAGVHDAFYACLGDLFVMREPVGAKGQLAVSPGTEAYRCPNSGEASMATVAISQLGLRREAEAGYRWAIESQGSDGDWNDPDGWSHRCWGMAGFKAWAVLEQYLLNRDRDYLAMAWPHLLANSRWQERQRQRTRQLVDGQKPLHYGLMPRGVGDCGLDAGDGWYGYFLPHNAWAVNADRVAMLAAGYLGHRAEEAECRGNFERAKADLLSAMDRGAIAEDGYRWIPGSPGNRAGSRWGVLNSVFPCELLPPDHELITGTLRYMSRQMSPGGLHVHTGWMADGMWVAISLDNVAEVELRRGNGDEAARLLYASLNHGTPLLTWCEERGQKPGTDQVSGDRQHLWTPAAVVRALRDMLVMEQDGGLHLALGTDRGWLGSGQPLGIAQAPTHFGPVSYSLRYDAAAKQVLGEVTFPTRNQPAWVALHVRLPDGLKLTGAAEGATLSADGQTLRFERPKGRVKLVLPAG